MPRRRGARRRSISIDFNKGTLTVSDEILQDLVSGVTEQLFGSAEKKKTVLVEPRKRPRVVDADEVDLTKGG